MRYRPIFAVALALSAPCALAAVSAVGAGCSSSANGSNASGPTPICTIDDAATATLLAPDAGNPACIACIQKNCTPAIEACGADCVCSSTAYPALTCLELLQPGATTGTATACVGELGEDADTQVTALESCLSTCTTACIPVVDSGAGEDGSAGDAQTAPDSGSFDASLADDSGSVDSGAGASDTGSPKMDSGNPPEDTGAPPPPPPTITTFTASVPGGVPSSAALDVVVANATTCTIDDGSGAKSSTCNGMVAVSPTATTTYTLRATNAGGPSTASLTISCGAVSDPGDDAGVCPSGSTIFCEPAPIDVTSSTQASDACSTCAGAACSSASAASLGGGSAYAAPDGTDYVWQAGTSAASACTATYQVQPGDILAGGVCPSGRW